MKINKAAARKLFEQGERVWIVPCNMRKECGLLLNTPGLESQENNFNNIYNSFCYYNCDHERGYYPAFYTDN